MIGGGHEAAHGRPQAYVAAVATSGTRSRSMLELPLDQNPSTVSVSSSDVRQLDLSELSDVILALEYTARDV